MRIENQVIYHYYYRHDKKRNVQEKVLIDWLTTYVFFSSLRYSIRFWLRFCTIHPRFIALHSVPWPDLAWPLAAVVVMWMWGILDLGVNDDDDKTSNTLNTVQQMITSLYLTQYNTIFLLVHPLFVGSNVTVWIWPYKPTLLLHYHV